MSIACRYSRTKSPSDGAINQTRTSIRSSSFAAATPPAPVSCVPHVAPSASTATARRHVEAASSSHAASAIKCCGPICSEKRASKEGRRAESGVEIKVHGDSCSGRGRERKIDSLQINAAKRFSMQSNVRHLVQRNHDRNALGVQRRGGERVVGNFKVDVVLGGAAANQFDFWNPGM